MTVSVLLPHGPTVRTNSYTRIDASIASQQLHTAVLEIESTPKTCITELGEKHIDHEQLSRRDNDRFGISHDDRMQILQWNHFSPQATNSCLHTLVEQRVLLQPDAEALCSSEGILSYRQLDDLASRLSHLLVFLGVGAEVIVPLCFDKSIWAAVAMLGVVKAGGAVVMLNPRDPVSRREAMMRETKSTIVLVDRERQLLFESLGATVVLVESSTLETLDRKSGSACLDVGPNNVAALVFTSGTSGEPKGIILEHAGLCTTAIEQARGMRWKAGMRVFQFAAYSFDASIGEIFFTLIHGGCVCIPTETERINDLSGSMNRMGVNWAFLTPSTAALLAPADVPNLEVLIVGGEILSEHLMNTWSGEVYLVEAYGPAECSVFTSTAVLEPEVSPTNIGRACGARFWVVDPDDHERLCTIGEVGELIVEGAIVARGYLNNPERTASSFLGTPNWLPKTDQPPHRLYKTGDLVNYNTDGSMNYVIRKDTQVKFHGQRIEMGEIEHHIRQALPKSSQGISVDLIAPIARNETKVIAAFLVSSGHEKETVSSLTGSSNMTNLILPLSKTLRETYTSLQKTLSQILPIYMVPSLFIPIAYQPLSLNGKLDRKTLKKLANCISEEQLMQYSLSDMPKRLPKSSTERQLQTLWAQVLGVKPNFIGADDSFFGLGGDSIIAMKLVAAAQYLRMKLTVADIFRHPVLSELAKTMEVSSQDDNHGDDLALQPFELLRDKHSKHDLIADASRQCDVGVEFIEDILPCTPVQERLMTFSNRQRGSWSVLQKVYQLPEDSPTFTVERLKQAWRVLTSTYSILRTRVINTSSGSFQVILSYATPWGSGNSLKQYLEKDRATPITYGVPLLRHAIVTDSIGTRYLVWTIHHALYDGWTIPILLDRLGAIYNHIPVPEDAPFPNFIKYIVDIDPLAADAYWQTELSNSTPSEFPTMPTAPYEPQPGLTTTLPIPNFKLNPSLNITVSTLLRAAWSLVIAHYTSSTDLLFVVTLSGRQAPVPLITSMLGPTVAQVPLRTRLDDKLDLQVWDFLAGVQRQATDMIPFEQTGLAKIAVVGAGVHDAVRFKSTLLVQSAEIEGAALDVPGVVEVAQDDRMFNTYPLVMECVLGVARIDFKAYFDGAVISRERTQGVLRLFATFLELLNGNDMSRTAKEVLLTGVTIEEGEIGGD
jgi:amino acid adenylation domain-containing protein